MTPTTTMTPSQALSQWTDQVGGAMRDWWDSSSQAWQPLWQAWAQPMESLTSVLGGAAPGMAGPQAHSHEHHTRHAHGPGHRHEHHHGHDQGSWGRTGCDCGCSDSPWRSQHGSESGCGCSGSERSRSCCDPCACCIPDADVVVHTRLGERRVVPFELCNERHREREVTLAVGDWVACDGPALAVKAVLTPSGALTLAPCERRVVRLVVTVTAAPPPHQEPPSNQDPANDQPPGDVLEPAPGREPAADLDACATAYTDVRFQGCARPVRVAVVVHPAACDALPVDCGCGCC